MVGIYAHLTARDVDAKDLFLHGLNGRTCQKCHSNLNPGSQVLRELRPGGESLNERRERNGQHHCTRFNMTIDQYLYELIIKGEVSD